MLANVDRFPSTAGPVRQQNSAQLTIIKGSAFIYGENQTWLRRKATEWKF
jgi:hypothetical protein